MTQRPEDNETFIRFVQAAREDRGFGDLLRSAARLPKEQRNVLLDQMAAKMELHGESKDLIEVVLWLREEGIFRKVIELLDEPGPS